MKKKLAALLATVMILSMGMTAFATDSKNTTDEQPAGVTTTTDGASVTKVDDKVVAEVGTKAAAINKNAKVLAVFDLNGPIGKPITLNVAGVKKGANIIILHQKADGTWERINPDAVGDGYVIATFKSLSNVAVIELPAAKATGNGTSPKTGYLF